MKPTWSHCLALVAALGLAACGGGDSDSSATADPPAPAPAPPPAPGPAPSPPPAPAPPPPPTGSFTIARVEFAQSMVFASQDPELVLVSDRAALAKVNLVSSQGTADKPSGVLRIEDAVGNLLRELPLNAPTGSVPTAAPAQPSFADSYSATIPAELVRSGLRVAARFTPAAGNQATIAPRVGGGVALRIVTVPVQIAGTLGQVVPDADGWLRARLPAASVTRVDHAPFQSSQVDELPTTSSGWSSAFSAILGEIDDLHMLEGASSRTYYYGFIPKRSSGLAGMGYRPGNAAVGFDLPGSPNTVRETMVHEVGHNLSLRHAPCGDASSPDPNYPYANAAMGAGNRFVWGYDAADRRFIDPRPSNVHDVMSYCSGNWFSDYHYRRMQVHLTPADGIAAADAGRVLASAAVVDQELLLVSGEIRNGVLRLNPLKSGVGRPRAPLEGPYLLRITTRAGALVEHRFDGREIDHMPDVQRFGFTIAHPGAIERVEVLHQGRVLAQRAAREQALAAPGTNAPVTLQADEQGGMLALRWDAARHPFLTVTHVGATRTVIAIDLRGGSATVPTAKLPQGGRFEFGLSDGLNTERVTVER